MVLMRSCFGPGRAQKQKKGDIVCKSQKCKLSTVKRRPKNDRQISQLDRGFVRALGESQKSAVGKDWGRDADNLCRVRPPPLEIMQRALCVDTLHIVWYSARPDGIIRASYGHHMEFSKFNHMRNKW